MDTIVSAFNKGGTFMYPILVVSILVVGITIERIVALYITASVDRRAVLAALEKMVRAGEIDRAVKLVSQSRAPMMRVLKVGLSNFNEKREVIQLLMDEAALSELPRLESRTGYLAMLSNVGTLAGLLGTIVGLIHSFASVANAKAAEKSTELAKGISEAMNCTAFGLVVAIPALLAYAVLQGRTHRLVDDVNQSAVALYNIITDVKHPGPEQKAA